MPLVLLLGLFFSALSVASPEAAEAAFHQQFPDLKIDKVEPSAVSGLYQLSSGPLVIYLSENGRYVFQGNIFDLHNKQDNITEKARKTALVTALQYLQKEGAQGIEYPAPNSQYTLTVFTDVSCGYCRKFHQSVPTLNKQGVSVRYLAFPRNGESSASYRQLVSVWCGEDPKALLTNAKAGQTIPEKMCVNPVKKHHELGLLAGVQGTPTLVLPDGTLVPGYIEPGELINLLQAE